MDQRLFQSSRSEQAISHLKAYPEIRWMAECDPRLFPAILQVLKRECAPGEREYNTHRVYAALQRACWNIVGLWAVHPALRSSACWEQLLRFFDAALPPDEQSDPADEWGQGSADAEFDSV